MQAALALTACATTIADNPKTRFLSAFKEIAANENVGDIGSLGRTLNMTFEGVRRPEPLVSYTPAGPEPLGLPASSKPVRSVRFDYVKGRREKTYLQLDEEVLCVTVGDLEALFKAQSKRFQQAGFELRTSTGSGRPATIGMSTDRGRPADNPADPAGCATGISIAYDRLPQR